ncbi:cytochrome c biogenesis CcdA family protein [Methylocaldum sp. MU1018]
METLTRDETDIEVRFHDIATKEGAELFKKIVEHSGLPWSLPITIVGTDLIQGFDTPETTGQQIRRLIERNRGRPGQGFTALLGVPPGGAEKACDSGPCPEPTSFFVKLPFVGVVDAAVWSLPILAITLGFLDGFNPCAMWVLATFLLVLMHIGSRRRMWAVAGLFIVAETVMYFAILNLWFQVWDFVGMDKVITPLVGIVAIGGGLFFLYEWFKSLGTEMACKVVDLERRSRIVSRIKRISSGRFGVLTAAAVIGLAFSVNIIEFACSIGYPQAFTKIVEMNSLGFWSAQAMIGLYTLFYMADDFLVFGLALWGFGKLHLAQKYSRWTALVGGWLMLALGWLLVFHPDKLRLP